MGATCREGCSHCCTLPASASLPEAAAIVDFLSSRADWPRVRPQLERALAANLEAMGTIALGAPEARAAFFSKQVPCVFLADGRCSVYAVRPAVCRYHVVVSPPENCALGAADDMVVRIDLTPFEDLVALKGAQALGRLTGGSIATAVVIAAEELGVELHVPQDALGRSAWYDGPADTVPAAIAARDAATDRGSS